jgi:hypothetical protein
MERKKAGVDDTKEQPAQADETQYATDVERRVDAPEDLIAERAARERVSVEQARTGDARQQRSAPRTVTATIVPGMDFRHQEITEGVADQPEERYPVGEERYPADDALRHHLGMAFDFPPHLRDALLSWVDSVEERLSGVPAPLADRVDAVEARLADLHEALLTRGPKSVQAAVADVGAPEQDGGK